jgi:hypothetical protein
MFCITLMQRFTTDVYLNAFLSELKQIGLDYTVLERRPTRVASRQALVIVFLSLMLKCKSMQ